MRIRWHESASLLALMLISVCVHAKTCKLPNSHAESPPDWVTNSGSDTDNSRSVSAVGVSNAFDTSMDQSIAAARVQASRSLAERIRVDIAASIKVTESKKTFEGRDNPLLQSTVESVAESTTAVTLQNLVYDKQWFDVEKCLVWIRASLSAADFERAKTIEASKSVAQQIEALIRKSDDSSAPSTDRDSASQTALVLLQSTDFKSLPEFVPSIVKKRIDEIREKVAQSKKRENAANSQIFAHSQKYSAMVGANSPAERRGLAVSALKLLRQATQDLPPASYQALPFDALKREFDLTIEARFLCQSKSLLQTRSDLVSSLSPSQKAELNAKVCDPQALASERAGEFLAGSKVVVVCAQRISGQVKSWDKACSELSKFLTTEGSLVQIVVPKDEKGFRNFQNSSFQEYKRAESDSTFVLLADGKINARLDNESNSKFFRYEGKVTGLFNGEKINFTDAYDGLTGWNPVSEGMSMDLLALGASQRLMLKFREAWLK